MGCGSSNPKVRKSETPIDPITVPEWVNSYPPREPPVDTKADIFDESQYVDKDRKAASVGTNFNSYESLIDALTKDCQSEVDKIRAIFVWLFHLDIFNTYFGDVTDPHTPRGYMKLIKSGDGTYEAFFALLCRFLCSRLAQDLSNMVVVDPERMPLMCQ